MQKWIKSFEEKALDFATKAVANDKAGQVNDSICMM